MSSYQGMIPFFFLLFGLWPSGYAQDVPELEKMFRDGKHQEVVAESEKLLKEGGPQGDQRLKILSLAASSQRALNHAPEAIELFERMLQESPEKSVQGGEALEALAELYRVRSDPHREAQALQRLLQEMPRADKRKLAQVYSGLADAHRRLRNPSRSIEIYKEAAAALQDSPELAASMLMARASLLGYLGNYLPAAQAYREIADAFPGVPATGLTAMAAAADLQQATGLLKEAQVTLQEAFERFLAAPGSEALAAKLARLHRQSGDLEAGRKFCDSAIARLSPESRTLPVRMELAAILRASGRLPSAALEYRNAIVTDPTNVFAPVAQRNIVEVILAMGDTERAGQEAAILFSALSSSLESSLFRELADAQRLISALWLLRSKETPALREWLQLQSFGTAEKPWNANAVSIVLSKPAWTEQERALWKAALERFAGNNPASRRRRGYLFLYQSLPEAAIQEFAEAYAGAENSRFAYMTFHDLGVAFKALTGNSHDAGELQSWLRQASANPSLPLPEWLKNRLPADAAQKLTVRPKETGIHQPGTFERIGELARKGLGTEKVAELSAGERVFLDSLQLPAQAEIAVKPPSLRALPPPVLSNASPLPALAAGRSPVQVVNLLSQFETSLARSYLVRAEDFLQKDYFEHARQEYEKVILLMPHSSFSLQATRGMFKVFAASASRDPGNTFQQRADWWLEMMKGSPEAELGKILMVRHKYAAGNAQSALKELESYAQSASASNWGPSVQCFLAIHDLRLGNEDAGRARLEPLFARWNELKEQPSLRASLAQLSVLLRKPEEVRQYLGETAEDSSASYYGRISQLLAEFKAAEEAKLALAPLPFKKTQSDPATFTYKRPTWDADAAMADSYQRAAENLLRSGDTQSVQFINRFFYGFSSYSARFQTHLKKLTEVYGELE